MTRAPLSQLNDWELVNSDQDLRGQTLYDQNDTAVGTVREMIVNTDTEYIESVVLDTGEEIPSSRFRITDRGAQLVRAGATEAPTEPVSSGTSQQLEGQNEIIVPIVEEQIRVGKRQIERGGVRVETRVEEVPVQEQVHLRDEEVHVERRPVDRIVNSADLDTIQEGTIEIRERDEQAVVEKQARVVEEVRISKDVQDRTETVQDTVRRTHLDVERLDDRQHER